VGIQEQRPAGTRLALIVKIKDWHASSNRARMAPMQKKKRADAIRSENGLCYAVRIDATFGSQFQRTVAIKNLNRMLAAWKDLVEAQHKKNAITVIRSRD